MLEATTTSRPRREVEEGLFFKDNACQGIPGLQGRILSRSIDGKLLQHIDRIDSSVEEHLVGKAIGKRTAIFLKAERLRALLPPCSTPAGELALRRHLLNPPGTCEGVLAMRATLDLINNTTEVRDSLNKLLHYARSKSILDIPHHEAATSIASLRTKLPKTDDLSIIGIILQPIVFALQSHGHIAAQRRSLRNIITLGSEINSGESTVLHAIKDGFSRLSNCVDAKWLKGNLILNRKGVRPMFESGGPGYPLFPSLPPFDVGALGFAGWTLLEKVHALGISIGNEFLAAGGKIAQAVGALGLVCFYSYMQLAARSAFKRRVVRSELPLALDLLGEAEALLTLADFRASALKNGWKDAEILDQPRFRSSFVNLRNPIVEKLKHSCVPNNITIESGKIVIVTGPNSGGKTTLAQAVIHAQIFTQVGLPNPSDRSTVSPADQIFYVGPQYAADEEEGRFGTELESGSEVIDYATPRSLVVLDEMAGGTNSLEQTEIAGGALDGLRMLEVPTLLITHDFALARLRQGANAECFMVGKEGELRTFKLQEGISESSGAMDIARKLHMDPQSIVRRVRKRLGLE